MTESPGNINLKGQPYPLVYYRAIKDNVTIEKSRWKNKDGEMQQFYYHDPVMKKIIFNEEKVKGFSLDGLGQNLEFEDRHFTLIHNYLIRFWQHFLKADGLALFITLKSYCIDKDYCWPSLSTLQLECGFGSINTLKKKLTLLENLGFVFRFNCMSKEDRKINMEESPIFKVRKRVPFLPKELYEELPEELRTKHDSFMKNYMAAYDPENLAHKIDFDSIYEDFLGQGESLAKNSKRASKGIPKLQQMNIKETMTKNDEEITIFILDYIKSHISKPSFETWFQHCLFKLRENILTVYCQSDFSASWINDRHKDLIDSALTEKHIKPFDIKICSVKE
ncbi:DnaA N-terminal domain-containing protein [Bacillus infantis]|uniref:DnaA N-terminal domain-containing protein n=1 Tax=Bacillus infantis TaxID=324767 RepID=UPI0021CC85A5|nr:DnaA N-terminal domain-containing protein [Bacillus infantis]